MRNSKYTEEILKEAVLKSNSVSEVLRRIGANPTGNTRKHIRKRLQNLNISTEHFTYKSNDLNNKKNNENIFVNTNNNVRIPGKDLKKALLKEGRDYLCAGEDCQLPPNGMWGNKLMPLDVDHIDGNYKNNLIENLRFLCPNCHRLTETFGNKKHIYDKKPNNKCLDCNTDISRSSKRCKICSNKNKQIIRSHEKKVYPKTPVLVAGVKKFGYVAYSKTIGLSDNGLRKLLKRRGIENFKK